ncbi:MAG: CBS domain-containing protein [Pseudomonadota bacterium]
MMNTAKKVRDLMIPLVDYPHIPYWFSIRQAVAMLRETAVKMAGTTEPRTLLVFDEKYQLMGMLTLRDIIRGLEPRFLQETDLIKVDPGLTLLIEDLFGPNTKEAAEKPISDVMSPIKVTVNADDPISRALYLMIQEYVGRMPVMEGRRVVGIIRLNDLFSEITNMVLSEE